MSDAIRVPLTEGPKCALCGITGAHYCTGGQKPGPAYIGVRSAPEQSDWSHGHAYTDTPPERALEVMARWLMETGDCMTFCTLTGKCATYDLSDCIAALVHEAKEVARGRA